MTDDHFELIMEVLRRIQSDIANLKADTREIKSSLSSLQQQVHVLEGFSVGY
jgi:prefoldin subunit 5